MGPPSRWDNDGVDLKYAILSCNLAGVQLGAAYELVVSDPSESRRLLEYAVDQAALAHGFLCEVLRRHGRALVRPVIHADLLADETPAGEPSNGSSRYRQRISREVCVNCEAPAERQPDGRARVRCKACAKAARKARKGERIREMKRINAASRVRDRAAIR